MMVCRYAGVSSSSEVKVGEGDLNKLSLTIHVIFKTINLNYSNNLNEYLERNNTLAKFSSSIYSHQYLPTYLTRNISLFWEGLISRVNPAKPLVGRYFIEL